MIEPTKPKIYNVNGVEYVKYVSHKYIVEERDRIAREEGRAEYEERLQPVVERLKAFVDEYTKT